MLLLMRKFSLSVFVILFFLCFPNTESFAFTDIWKNANPKCKKWDFYCKRTSPKMTKEEVEQMSSKEIEKISTNKNKKIKKITDKNYAECKKYDFRCKRLSKKKYGDKKIKRTAKKIENYDSDTELNVFAGMFDFSDDKQRSGTLGLQHQDDNLFRKSFLGRISPITGGFITEKNAFYLYTGAQAEYDLGFVTITPSFAPGYYNYGDGKDLGYPLEFKSEVQMSFNFSENTQLGMSYNHISNASLGTKNPGANSYMFNFLKQF